MVDVKKSIKALEEQIENTLLHYEKMRTPIGKKYLLRLFEDACDYGTITPTMEEMYTRFEVADSGKSK